MTDASKDEVAAQVLRASRGDSGAREWIAGRAYTAGLRLATFSLGDPNLAQDVGQEVAIRVLRGLAKLRDADRFDAWTYRICAGEIKRAAKKRQRHDWHPYDAVERELQVEATFPQSLGERDWLIRALARLSDRQRLVLGLHYVYGLDDREIATAIRSRRGTVRSLLSRALARLREQAEAEEPNGGREAAVARFAK
ncbi:MAG TPA: RNA polymerase sigma factor, partial [Solirubrobacterales bacterium]|nr:RNA polymerase sigma factor [Solirubrobacterales bacterium]